MKPIDNISVEQIQQQFYLDDDGNVRNRVNRGANDKPIPKLKQTAMCGNSVCHGLAEALVRVNMVVTAAGRAAA